MYFIFYFKTLLHVYLKVCKVGECSVPVNFLLHKAKGVGWGWGVAGQADKGFTFGSLKMFLISND